MPVQLYLWPDRLLYLGPSFDAAPHRHHAVQLALALGAPLQLRHAPDGPWQTAPAALIPADVSHQLAGGEPRVALLYLEADSRSAAFARGLDAPQMLPAEATFIEGANRLGEDGDIAEAADLCARWLLSWERPMAANGQSRPWAAPSNDSRIGEALAILRDRPLPAAAIAREVGLSASRFMRLFRAHTGVPLRRYLLWQRLRRALSCALRGDSLTTAAHAAGFADSAHLSHAFRDMFGLPPAFLFEHRTALRVRFGD